ncbi:coiled-coil domain-containing protein 30 isoform X2 [Cheilinus undulatus]|uniref:coiled-coil domain-containing protein 30 isoform X2 n=1 Tax=Cheilinus undulatus TaxID=241271 RepID=UPI001BD2D09E|nr:coiled-coil domain-containing protein 30 isoform X2 [Cheilinus undulatus]
MDQPEEELQQIAKWLCEEGLPPGSPKEVQLCVLWRALQRTRSRLSSVTRDLDRQRLQYSAELTDVRKSLEQIRIFTEHKDVLAQEIQDENDQLKDQLRRLISLQDAQISEVAKMLYQQGLTELIHSSPSEQVAYLLVERASFFETSEAPIHLKGHTSRGVVDVKSERQCINTHQSPHKGAVRHHQNPWKRLFGLHKASQSKHTFIPAEARHLAGQASSMQRECSRLERDLEEGSRRLAMAHNEIRHLTDELESAHLTQRAYEPELQAAQQEVEQLRQEVEKLKKYEMVELRKTKELNDRLDLEIRALRNRVRTLDAEKNSLQQKVVSLQREVERLQSSLQEQRQPTQQLLTMQVQGNPDKELAEIFLQKEMEQLGSAPREQLQTAEIQTEELTKSQEAELVQIEPTCRKLQEELDAQKRCLVEKEETVSTLKWRDVERLQSALQEQQLHTKQKLLTVQAQASQANELAQSTEICKDLQNKLDLQSRCLLEKESEIHTLKQQLDDSQKELDKLMATIFTTEKNLLNSRLEEQWTQILLLQNKENTKPKDFPEFKEAVKILLATQDECETLKKEICETLQCLDKERSKYHEIKEKHRIKLLQVKQKLNDETTRRDEKIHNLERELSLCSHSLAKEKEVTMSIAVENDKLLVERRRLLQQLNEEENNKKDCNLTASLSKCRVDFLEMENKKLGNKILHMSTQLAVLERSLQNMQTLHLNEELKKRSNPVQVLKSLSLQASRPLTRASEMGYLNVTSNQSLSDHTIPSASLSSSDRTCS